MTLRCCQLVRKGRFVAADPYFEGGELISIAHAKRYHDDVGKLAVVSASRNVGRVVEVLGGEDDVRAVLRGLLAERGAFGDPPPPGRSIDDPPPEVEEQVASFDAGVPDLDAREDLRSQLCVTIDPPGARDHDDAIGLEEPPAGSQAHAVLWVHIADVAAYVTPGSPLDLHALDRALSVYVPGLVAPMLPHRLSSDLCSLVPGVDRGCVSVRVELSRTGKVLGVRFARTVIRSARRLSYEEVDRVLESEAQIDPVIDDLLRRLDVLTATVRGVRMQRGALDMQMPELVFALGELRPDAATLEPESPSHRLVEECMLLANEAVGGRLARAQEPCIFRLHDEPDPDSVQHLLDTFARLGVPTPPVPEDMHGTKAAQVAAAAAALAARYSDQTGRGRRAFVPRVLRALKQAQYRPTPGRHSGLAVNDYAHFTSPIRRYPDLVNHRSLLRMLGLADDEPSAVDIAVVAEHVSFTEREAMAVERRANDIVLAHLLHDRLYGECGEPERPQQRSEDGVYRGEVVGLNASGAFVRFAEVFDGYVPARTLGLGERHELDEHGLALIGTASGERVQLGDPIDVVVHKIDRARGKIELRRAGAAGAQGDGDRRSEERRSPYDRRRRGGAPRGTRGSRPVRRRGGRR